MEGREVKLVALRCLGCGGALTIAGNYLCECEYCGGKYVVSNLPDIVQAVKERKEPPDADYFYAGSVLDEPYCPYFYNWSTSCEQCAYFDEYRWRQPWCRLHNVAVEPDMTCGGFRAK
jgi:hypothetical protein